MSLSAKEARERVEEVFRQSIEVHERVLRLDTTPILVACDALTQAFAMNRKALIFGNGGSAADAQHMAAELVCRFVAERRALPAIALSADASVLTAIGNDCGYEQVFARQVEALGEPGDIAIGISASGRSPNVVAGLTTAKARAMRTVALTGGDGGAVGRSAQIHLNVPHPSVARVQEVHRTILHAMCELIENGLF